MIGSCMQLKLIVDTDSKDYRDFNGGGKSMPLMRKNRYESNSLPWSRAGS